MNVAVGAACTAATGEDIAGDEVIVARDGHLVLIGLADGLGHGPHAARAAAAFCGYVRERVTVPLEDLLLGAGEQLSATRGAAAALLRVDEAACEVEFAGVGNIALKSLSQASLSMFCCAGILGRRVRKLRSFRAPVVAGDILVLHSDGVSTCFDLRKLRDPDPDVMARRIVGAHRKPADDATCVVAMFRAEVPL